MKKFLTMKIVLFIAAILLFACENPTGTDTTPPPTGTDATYAVTYHLNGATGGTIPSDLSTYTEKSSVTVLGNPGNLVKDGYPFFVGWNTEADGSGSLYREGDNFVMPGNDLILYAEFSDISKLLSSGGRAGDNFGYSVAISGDYAIVGARGVESDHGAAYIFRRTGTNSWDAGTKIIASDGTVNDNFGYSVAISGDYAIVGAFLADISGKTNQGAAYIFRRTDTNSWDEGTKIVASDGAANDYFGSSVAISGDYAILGAYRADINGDNQKGAAYIFNRTDTNSWDAGTKIVASDGAFDDYFGFSVAISGDFAIVGVGEAGINSNWKHGAAYIFRLTGTNSWDTGAKIIASDGAADDNFGYSVAISGDYAIVGARQADISDQFVQGAAYIFRRTGTNSWDAGTKIIASDGATNDKFGSRVAISGDYAIVGVYLTDISGNSNQGAAYVFNRTGTNSWDAGTKIVASDGAADDNFGFSVAISGDYAIVGAMNADIRGSSKQGSAYILNM